MSYHPRVQRLPWNCQLFDCSHGNGFVYLWRARVRCLCQLASSERYQLSHDMRLDLEEQNGITLKGTS